MSIIDRIALGLGYSKTAVIDNPPEWLRATAAAEKFSVPSGELYWNQADLYRRLSWLYTAVTISAQTAASEELHVNELVGEKSEQIVNHPFEKLLDRPNPKQSEFEFMETTYADKKLTGNAFWWLNRLSEDAEPLELWTIPPYKLQPVPDERMYLRGYLYDPGDGQSIPLDLWEVVHFRSYNPVNEWMGLSGVEPIAVVAAGDLKMQDWNTRLFAENNARLPGILSFADPINDTDWDRLKRDTVEASAKRQIMMLRNAGKGGVDWMQAASTMKDMEFLAGRKFTKEEIFSVFAPGLASILDVNATEANAKAGKATFIDFCIWPMLQALSNKVTNDVLPAYGENLIAEYDDIRVTDKVMELTEQQEYEKSHTIDEIREKYYNSEPLGDERGELLPAQIGSSPVGVDEGEQPILAPELFQPREAEPVEEPEPEEEATEGKAVKAELKAWENFAVKRLGKEGREFVCEALPDEQQERITTALKAADTAEGVKRVFEMERTGFSEMVSALVDVTEVLRMQDDHAPD